MPERRTPAEIADQLNLTADILSTISNEIRILAQDLRPPPDLPEASRSGHYS